MVNLYIDALAKRGHWDALDRIIAAQGWVTGVLYQTHNDDHCLIGHAGGYYVRVGRHGICRGLEMAPVALASHFGLSPSHNRFDKLVERFGMDRVVRAIKQRAGRHTKPNIEQPHTSDSEVAEYVGA